MSLSSKLASDRIAKTSFEGLCQALACELFPEFKEWFDANPELRPEAPEYNLTNRGLDGKLTTIPMHYKGHAKASHGEMTAEIPVEVRKEHPESRLKCKCLIKGQMHYITEITYCRQTEIIGETEEWSFKWPSS